MALGYEVATFIRTPAQVAAIARYEPFQSFERGAADLNIIFLAAPFGAAARKQVSALCTASDDLRVRGREIYWLRRRQPGGYDFRTLPLDKVLGQPFTIRGSRTVSRLAAKYCA